MGNIQVMGEHTCAHASITDVVMTLLYSFTDSSLPLAVVRSYVFVAS